MTSGEQLQGQIKTLTEAMKCHLPDDVGGIIILFHKSGDGRQELGCSVGRKDLVVRVLVAAVTKIAKGASRVWSPN